MKTRKLTLVLTLLAVLAFTSIGFATWVITKPATDIYSEGAIIVDDATNGAYQLIVPEDAGNIVFGVPAELDSSYSQVWLANDDNVEVLSQIITIQVDTGGKKFADIIKYVNDISVNLEYISYTLNGNNEPVENSKTDEFNYCVEQGYIVAPKLYYLSEDNWTEYTLGKALTVEEAFDDNGVCKFKIEFAWGATFNSINPYDYYNGQTYSIPLADEAQANLNDLYSHLKDVLYKLTITG